MHCRPAGAGLASARRRLQQRTLRSLDEVPADYELIVNCSGLGARELAGDSGMEGVRGQYLLVRLPEPPPGLFIEDDQHPKGISQMFPRRDAVCVEGTEGHGVEDLAFVEDVRALLERAAETSPWLRDVDDSVTLGKVVGIRPHRPRECGWSALYLRMDGQSLITTATAVLDSACRGDVPRTSRR